MSFSYIEMQVIFAILSYLYLKLDILSDFPFNHSKYQVTNQAFFA
jgi:hypothetical protein